MAGLRITQLRPQQATGRRYGSFAGRSVGAPPAHPVGVLTQLRPQHATGRRYGSFTGRTAGPVTPLQAGTVPIRYILGVTANVVPVVTVSTWEIGVVRCREFVGPANVVPVREVTTEFPHVKIVKA